MRPDSEHPLSNVGEKQTYDNLHRLSRAILQMNETMVHGPFLSLILKMQLRSLICAQGVTYRQTDRCMHRNNHSSVTTFLNVLHGQAFLLYLDEKVGKK